MKKFYFLFLFALIASIGNLYAAEVTVTSTFKDKDLTVGVGEPGWVASIAASTFETSGSKRGVQFGAAKGAFTLTTKVSFSKVKKVSVLLSSNENGNTVSLKVGDTSVGSVVSIEKKNNYSVEWTAESPQNGIVELSFNDKKKSIYIKSISITYEEVAETKCATPTFTPAAGYLKLGNAITFTSATADAEISYQYSYNGGEYTSFVKGTSFTPDKEGTYKIIAKATKTGLEDGVSGEQIYEVENLVFYESFDKNDGTGGNDGQWNGNIATNEIQYDVAGWTCENAKGANMCAKFGTGGAKGKATTPALTGLAGDAVLTFKAGAWNVTNEKTTLNISITNGTLDKTSVELKKREFTEYTINITGADATSKITFEAAEVEDNRFFLDEVKVKQVAVATPTITPNGGDVKVGDKITFATKTDGATLSYSTDEGKTWTPGSEYAAATVGALNLWVKATKGSDESAVAKATFNVVDPNAIGSVNINITADKTAKTGELFGTMTVAVPMPINATVMDVVIKKDGKEFSSDKNLTAEFSKEITETGTYEIDVTANNDKEIIGDKKTAEFYSNKLTDIADFLLYGPECNNLFGSDVVYEFTCPLSVTYANGSNLWVTDGTDGMLIFQRGGFSTAYTNGTVFAKGIKGQYTVYNNTIELTEPVLTETTEGATVDPKQIEIAAISADNQNQFVIIKDAVLNVKNETFADAAGNTVDMYDKKFCTVPADGTYDVVGIVSYFGYSGAVPATQVYPLAFLTAPTATLGFTAAEINEMSWLAANDKVLTEDGSFEDINASCVKLTCEEGAQIEYTLDSGEPSPSTATVESGTEIGFTDGESYMLTVCAVKGGYKSASREYLFSIGKTSSVSSMSVDGVKVFAAEGGVEVVVDEAAEVAVYTAAGQLVRQARVAEGSTLVNVAPGFYVVRANGTATKVIVR